MFRLRRAAILMVTLVLVQNLPAVSQIFLTQQTNDHVTGLPVNNAPYTAQGKMTMDRKSANGTSIHKEYSLGTVARDSQGRCYRSEVRQNTIEGREGWQTVLQVHIWDPVAGVVTDWSTNSRITRIRAISGSEEVLHNELRTDGSESEAMTHFKSTVEKLDPRTIEGVLVNGVRTTSIIPASREGDGNDQPKTIVHEVWTSPELHVIILTILDNPRYGVQRNELFDIKRGEPDISQFQPPAGNIVSDARSKVPQP